MNKTLRRFIAILGLFFVNLSLLYPLPASAALFSWNRDVKPVIAGIGSKSDGMWSFDSWSMGEVYLDTTPQELLLGSNKVIKAKNTTPTISEGLTFVVEASAYSSTPDQTDDSPFITASGTRVRPGIVATNFLPIGTVIRIPELYGERTFTVEDRMNRRYSRHVDIWFPDRSTALQFGRKDVVIEVVSI